MDSDGGDFLGGGDFFVLCLATLLIGVLVGALLALVYTALDSALARLAIGVTARAEIDFWLFPAVAGAGLFSLIFVREYSGFDTPWGASCWRELSVKALVAGLGIAPSLALIFYQPDARVVYGRVAYVATMGPSWLVRVITTAVILIASVSIALGIRHVLARPRGGHTAH